METSVSPKHARRIKVRLEAGKNTVFAEGAFNRIIGSEMDVSDGWVIVGAERARLVAAEVIEHGLAAQLTFEAIHGA